jgi:hypothetical protein
MLTAQIGLINPTDYWSTARSGGQDGLGAITEAQLKAFDDAMYGCSTSYSSTVDRLKVLFSAFPSAQDRATVFQQLAANHAGDNTCLQRLQTAYNDVERTFNTKTGKAENSEEQSGYTPWIVGGVLGSAAGLAIGFLIGRRSR